MIFVGSVRGYGKLLNVREKSGKNQGILKWMISGNHRVTRLIFRHFKFWVFGSVTVHMSVKTLLAQLPNYALDDFQNAIGCHR